ncbi:histidine kinase [Halobacteriales archaeon SW_12_71_31]|nr:MAG: histidine kinase [Halobacteriales archaeon SW_12_71_31]
MIPGLWLIATAFGTALGTAALIAALWRHRDEPGAGWFLAALTGQALWGAVYGTALLTTDPALRRALGVVGLALLSAVGVYFVAFALEYTGRGQLEGRPAGVVLALLPVVLLVLGGTNAGHGLLWTPRPTLVSVGGVTGMAYGFRPAAKVVGALAVGVVTLGSLLLFDTVFSYGPLYRREAFAVGVSVVPPMAALAVWLLEVGPAPELNFAPFLFLVHVVLDAYAFVGSDMFEFHPATRRRGERAAIDDLGSPVVVVDDEGRIVTTNHLATEVLGVDRRTALTTPLSAHFDDDLDHRTGGEVTVRADGSQRTFQVTATPLAVDDDTVGTTLVWQDVTDARRREQCLAVLNRVLRHNLRNDMSVVRGFASSAAGRAESDEVRGMLDTALAKTDDLLSLGRTARDIERTLGGEPRHDPVDVAETATAVATAVGPETAAVKVDGEDCTVATDRETLRTVLTELVENAVEHGVPATDGRGRWRAGDEAADGGQIVDGDAVESAGRGDATAPVRVHVDARPDTVVAVVEDDGPGLPEGELAVVETGEETALEAPTSPSRSATTARRRRCRCREGRATTPRRTGPPDQAVDATRSVTSAANSLVPSRSPPSIWRSMS